MATLAVAALGVVALTAGPAGAQVPCDGPQTASPATVSPASVLPGESVSLSGGGFVANQVLGVGLFYPPVVLASVASDANGNYAATIQLPFAMPPGQNEITVFGHGPNGTCHQSLALFTVRDVAPVVVVPPPVVTTTGPVPIVVQQPLARTGSPSAALVAAGLVAMVLGFHVLRVGGSRRPITG